MKLYEINAQLDELLTNGFGETCVDEETGEIDVAKADEMLEQLTMERQDKLENTACYIKALEADVDAIRAEEVKLAGRRKAKETKAGSLRELLKYCMLKYGDTKLDTPRAALSFRKSTAVEITNKQELPREYVKTVTEEKILKQEIGQALKQGKAIPGAELKEQLNLQIK